MSTHGPIQQKYKDQLRAIAKTLDEFLNGPDPAPRKLGFAVLMFEIGDNSDKAKVNYISNCQREDMLVAMKEFIARAEGMDPPISKTKN
jgi:hypothetical protein